jgi:hypothetical protein
MHTLEQLRDGSLAGIQRLQLACGLTEFPREIFDLADTLEILDLSGNALSTLPDDLPRLTRLRIIFCSNNQFTVLPAVLGACPRLSMIGFKSNRIAEVPATALPPSLRWLILTDNCISTLPASIGACAQLQKLMLAGNQLSALPESLAQCQQLELLRIAANRLTALPAWLLALPRLAWLASAGNPFSAADEASAPAVAPLFIGWDQLQIEHQLGEGASGVIYRALLRQSGADLPVALKLFKGAITSDGLPRCELAACVGAGSHPGLIPVLGEVAGHPNGVHGCVMALIDPGFHNLAGPPSLESCTRDSYPADKRFSPAAVLRIANTIASAAQHLHSRGIMHGDLYGHNILHTAAGEALLGDFGAASLFDPASPQAPALQRLEVRAFGLLLGELIERCDSAAAQPASTLLAELRDACVQPDAGARPMFKQITETLQLASARHHPSSSTTAQETMDHQSPLTVVQAQLDAFNARDIDALMNTYAADAEQFTLHGERLAKGHAELRPRYMLRFEEPDLHARLLSRSVIGNIVSDLELITRNFPEGRGTLEMLCLYEVADGLIQRASFVAGAKTICAG